MLHYETITKEMHGVGKIIFNTFSDEFYLAGAPALALHIGHRSSIDLDYFSPHHIDTGVLKNEILNTFISHTVKITYEEKDTLWCSIDGIKVSFITRADALLKPVIVDDSFRLASIEDLTVMKLSAICGRDEYKDYFDLACISQITDVRSWITWWQNVYEHIDVTGWIVALGSVKRYRRYHLKYKMILPRLMLHLD
jgi:hypothetical protein